MDVNEVVAEPVVINPYAESFLKNWPDTIGARLAFCEDKLGLKREWLVKMLELEGRYDDEAASMTPDELAAKYEYEIGCWTDVCGDCVQWAGWDVDRFADLPECQKKKALSAKCREWIMEKLFQKWIW